MGQPSECPHCHAATLLWRSPEESSWGGRVLHVCFNDECPYYIRGWEWMQSHYAVSCSYRYSRDPMTGHISPLPVWSSSALRNAIVSSPNREEPHA